MFWCDKVLKNVNGEQIINDSKTPSGRVHVGSLRGVLIHDAVFRVLKERKIPVRYRFGVDDYDPQDEIPANEGEHFKKYLGVPLCNVPAPKGSKYSDSAEHYISEFFDVFKDLGVETEVYRMRDIYRSGQFNEAIDTILKHSDLVRQIYLDVSKSERPQNWFPFQVICEKCGRIGTTEVTSYDGKEVGYKCRSDLVKWAVGCDYEGKISPFDGNGKLPWKLEWVAKWKVFGITIEGAGKDHSTKGGSRDVATHCLRKIFQQQAPLNIPYEFFLVGGAKMSSSRGLGASAREMTDFLPPEVLRFLMLRTQPNRPVNFSPDEQYITKIFNDFDRFHTRFHSDETMSDEDKRIYELSAIHSTTNHYTANFQLVTTLAQMPHLNVESEIEKHKGSPLSSDDKEKLTRRLQSARYWVDNYATEEEKTELQEKIPAESEELTATERAFLHKLAERLDQTSWTEDELQSAIFHAARTTPIKQGAAFKAIYRVLLNRSAGPKAGNLLFFLDPDFIKNRFKELSFSREEFLLTSSVSEEEFESFLSKPPSPIMTGTAEFIFIPKEKIQKIPDAGTQNVGIIEILLTLEDGKEMMKRISLQTNSGASTQKALEELGTEWVNKIKEKYNLENIQFS